MDSSVSSEQTDVSTNKKALMSSESEQAQGVESSVEEGMYRICDTRAQG